MKSRDLDSIKGGSLDFDTIDSLLFEQEEGRITLWSIRNAISQGIQRQLGSLEYNAGQCSPEQEERKQFIVSKIEYFRECLKTLSAHQGFTLVVGKREIAIPALDQETIDTLQQTAPLTEAVEEEVVDAEAVTDESDSGPMTIPMRIDHAVLPHKKRTMLELLNPQHLRGLRRLKRIKASRKEAV